MAFLTKKDVLDRINQYSDNIKFCPYCLSPASEALGEDGDVIYCSNEMCLCEEEEAK